MNLKSPCKLIFFLSFFSVCLFAGINADAEKIEKLLNGGNYKEAALLAKKTLESVKKDSEDDTLGNIYVKGRTALSRLGRFEEKASLQTFVMKKFPENLSILEVLDKEFSSGYILDGKVLRGYPRGFHAKRVHLGEYDRKRLLQHIYKAKKKFDSASPVIKGRYYKTLARFLNRERGQSWKLQDLTSLTEKPSYDENYSYSYSPPPADAEGNPVFYKIPVSFEKAANDGERLFYCWKMMRSAPVNTHIHRQGKHDLATFLYREFDFSFLDHSLKNAYYNDEENIKKLRSLKENETLCRLSSGVKKFTLPREYDYIRLFRESEEYSLLARIFVNRLQFEKAVKAYEKALKKNPANKEIKQEIQNITGDHGMLMGTKMSVEGTPSAVKLIYRNAESAFVTVRELDWKKLYEFFLAKRSKGGEKVPFDLYSFMDSAYYFKGKNIFFRDIAPWKELAQGKMIDSFSVPLSPREGHLNTGTVIGLPKIKKAGFYLVNIKFKDGNECETLYCVTKGVLLSFNRNGSSRILFCDAKTGKALPDKKFFFYSFKTHYARTPQEVVKYGGRVKITTEKKDFVTNKDGSFILPDQRKYTRNNISYLVSFDKEYPLLVQKNNWNFRYPFPNFPEREKLFFITDRPIYAPGDTVSFTCYIRTPSYRKNVIRPKEKTYSVMVRGARNAKIYSKTFVPDEKSFSFTDSFQLPEDAPLGNYRIYSKGGAISFKVEEFKKKEYELQISTEKPFIKNGEKLQFLLQGKYYMGMPVSGAKISCKVYRSEKYFSFPILAPYDFLYGRGYFYCCKSWMPPGRNVHWGNSGRELVLDKEIIADKEGKCIVTIPEEITGRFKGKDSLYTIKAELKDDSNSVVNSSASVTVSDTPFHVYILLDKGFYAPSDVINSSVRVYTPDGQEIREGFVIFSLYTQKRNTDFQAVKGKLLRRKKASLKEKNFSFTLPENGTYLLEAEVLCNKEKSISSHVIHVRSMKKTKKSDLILPDTLPLEVIRDKSFYAPGETARFLITSKKANGTFFLFRHPCRENSMEKVEIQGNSFVAEMAITEKDYPNTFFEVVTLQDGKVYSEKMEIFVPPAKKKLHITLLPAKKECSPREKLSLKIQLKDEKNNPVEGVFTLAIYDRKLEAEVKNNVRNIFAFFWNWKRQFYSTMQNHLNVRVPVHKGSSLPYITPLWGFWYLPEKSLHGFGMEKGKKDTSFDTIPSPAVNGRKMVYSRRKNRAAPVMAEAAALLGDASAGNPAGAGMETENPVTIRENFADSLLWIGRRKVGKNGEEVISIPVSDDLTSWRIRCWGVTPDNKVGEAVSEFLVNKKLMANLTLPRFLINGDRSTATVHIHNNSKNDMVVNISLETLSSSIVLEKGKKYVEKVKIPAESRKSIPFPILAQKEGKGGFLLKVHEVEKGGFSDGLKLEMPVLVKGSYKSVHKNGLLSGKKETEKVLLDIPAERKKDSAFLTVTFSPSTAGSAMRLLPFLAAEKSRNVFGIISRFLPALSAKKVLDTLKINFDALALKKETLDPLWKEYLWKNDVPVYTEKLFRKNLAECEKMLRSMQNSDGGWGWFSGNNEHSYADTTAECVEALFYLKKYKKLSRDPALEKGVNFLTSYLENKENEISQKKYRVSNTDAFCVKVLAQCGRKMEKVQEYLFQNKTSLSPYGLAMLGGSFAQESIQRKEIIRLLKQFLVRNTENGTAYLKIPYTFFCYWYGNENMTNAAFLELMLEEENSSLLCRELAHYLAINIQYSPWRNSGRSLGKVLQALSKYLLKNPELTEEKIFSISLDGKLWKKVKIGKKDMWKENSFTLKEDSPAGKMFFRAGKPILTLSKEGKGEILYTASLSYFSLEEKINAAGNEMKIYRNYYKKIPVKKTSSMVDGKGSSVKVNEERFEKKKLQPGEKLAPGDIVEVEIITQSGNDYDYVCIEDPLPAGVEYVKNTSGYKWMYSTPVYCEYRKSSARFFLRNLPRGKGNICYEVRMQIPGTYTILPAVGKGQYAPLLHCNTSSAMQIIKDK